MARGAKPATLAKLRDVQERRHQEALARGSKYAVATERRRQQQLARSSDAAAVGAAPAPASMGGTSSKSTPTGDATPPSDSQTSAEGQTPARKSATRTLLDEGLTGWIRRHVSKS